MEDILNIDKKSASNDQCNKTSPQNNKLDKASILRETADYLRKHHDSKALFFFYLKRKISLLKVEKLYMHTLYRFLFIKEKNIVLF